MESVERLVRSSFQAPWRKQLQWVGWFLLCVVCASLVAWVYVDISNKTILVGRQIQNRLRLLESVERQIEDRTSELATLLSVQMMETRARKMGFRPVKLGQILYMKLPHRNQVTPSLAPRSPQLATGAPTKPPHYSETLWQWLGRQFVGAWNFLGEMP